MSTSKDKHGEVCFTCDECGEAAYGGTLESKEAWADLKAHGWKAKQEDGTWSHTCPECS